MINKAKFLLLAGVLTPLAAWGSNDSSEHYDLYPQLTDSSFSSAPAYTLPTQDEIDWFWQRRFQSPLTHNDNQAVDALAIQLQQETEKTTAINALAQELQEEAALANTPHVPETSKAKRPKSAPPTVKNNRVLCTVCNNGLNHTTEANLRVHMNRVHNVFLDELLPKQPKRSNMCSVCKEFICSNNRGLASHERSCRKIHALDEE